MIRQHPTDSSERGRNDAVGGGDKKGVGTADNDADMEDARGKKIDERKQ